MRRLIRIKDASKNREAFDQIIFTSKIIAGIRSINRKTWQDKAGLLIQLLAERTDRRGGIDSAALIKAITPLEGGDPPFWNQLCSFFVESAIDKEKDERMTGLIADLLITSTGGDPLRAGHEINAYEHSHNLPTGSFPILRQEVGTPSALSEITSKLQGDLETYFQKPIAKLNEETMKMWEDIIKQAQWSFRTRLAMSIIIFLLGVALVIISMIKQTGTQVGTENNIYYLAAGLASMFLVIYSGPLKDIRQSIIDLGTANAAFIGYVHRVLEASHTFSYFYTTNKINFSEMTKSSAVIDAALKSTVELLNKAARDSSEGIFFKVSFLQNTVSEVNFGAPGGGEPGWVRQGRSCSRRRG